MHKLEQQSHHFFLAILASCILVFLASSCGKSPDEEVGKKSPDEEVVQQISIALFQAPASKMLIELLPEFEAATGIKVKYEVLPYADLKAKVEQQFFAGTSNFDVVMADCIWIPSFASRGYLGEVDESAWPVYDFEDLLPELDDYLGRYPKDGPRYGLPFMSNTHMMAFRPEVVSPVANRLGLTLPGTTVDTAWTWDEYYRVAEEISKAKSGDDKIYGTSLQARAGAWLVYEWNSVLFGFVDDKEARELGLPVFGMPAIDAMEYYSSLYGLAPPAALTWGHEEETSAVCSALVAMDATSNVELAADLLLPKCENIGTIEFAYPPVGVSGVGSPDMGGYGLVLSNGSDNKTSASAFMLWATSKDVHHRIVMGGGSPIRRSQIVDPEVLEKYPYLSFYDNLIRDSVYRARIPKWPELEDVISRELVPVMKGEKDPTDAVAIIQAWINDNLSQ